MGRSARRTPPAWSAPTRFSTTTRLSPRRRAWLRCRPRHPRRQGPHPGGARFFDGSARTLIGVCARTPASTCAPRGARRRGGRREERIDPAAFLAGLAERGVESVLCEGGGLLNRSLLAAGLVGRMFLLVFPLVLEATSVNLFEGGGPPARLRLDGCERQGEYVWLEYAVTGGSAR